MTKDKWLDLVDMVEAKFGIDKKYEESLGENIPGTKEIIEFNSPMGKIKLELVEKARLLDEKTLYSNRVGSDVKIDKIYSDEDKVNYMNAYKWDSITENWQRIDEGKFSF